MTVLKGGSRLISPMGISNIPGVCSSRVNSCASAGVMSANSALPALVDALIAAKRAAGSATLVPRSALIEATALDESTSPSARTDTGTIALSDSSGSSEWLSRYLRSAPPHIASTASLKVPSNALATVLMRANGQDWATKRRAPSTEVLIELVGTLRKGNSRLSCPVQARVMRRAAP